MKKISKKHAKLAELVEKSFQIEKEYIPECIYIISLAGWYIDMGFASPQVMQLACDLKKNKVKEVNDYLSRYYIQYMDRIEQNLKKHHPKREKFFSSAFNNHKNGDYIASTTVLLTQADGICYDKTKKYFFKSVGKKYIPQVEPELRKTSDEIIDWFLLPISRKTEINISTDYRGDINTLTKLNRHEILHGVDTDFGTELNSLKVISFVNYLDEILTFKIK